MVSKIFWRRRGAAQKTEKDQKIQNKKIAGSQREGNERPKLSERILFQTRVFFFFAKSER